MENVKARMQKPLGFDTRSLMRRIEAIAREGTYSNRGPQVQELEARISDSLGVEADRVIAVANGTLAIQSFLESAQIPAWRIPDFTFAATGLAAMASGKKLSLYDVESSNLMPKVTPIAKSRRGLLSVEPFGEVLSSPALGLLSHAQQGLIDAAAGLGNALDQPEYRYNGISTMFSLHATKVVGAGEGALLVVDENVEADSIRSWINFGFRGERVSTSPGTNAKMSELAAAAVNSVLDVWPARAQLWLETRETVHHTETLFELGHFHSRTSLSPYWILRTVDSDHSSRFRSALKNASIDSRQWWSGGLHSMAAFSKLARFRSFPGSKNLADTCVGVPYFAGMPSRLVTEIVELFHQSLLEGTPVTRL